jgi:hypothetical protein
MVVSCGENHHVPNCRHDPITRARYTGGNTGPFRAILETTLNGTVSALENNPEWHRFVFSLAVELLVKASKD